MIEASELTRIHGTTTVVDHLSFTVVPGVVTGFLGPNGAGKTTTLRLILGLDRPTRGTVTVGGRAFATRPRGLRHVGALLDAGDAHAGRTGRAHLRALAASNGLPPARVAAVLARVGLTAVAGRRVGAYSLGMRQRLGIAAALLGDPPVLLFDEPLNGLDPEGVRWARDLFRSLAAEGRTVLVSSHLMGEMEETAETLVVIGRGRLLAAGPLAGLAARTPATVRVRTPEPDRLAALLAAEGARLRREPDGTCTVTGAAAGRLGDLALRHRLALHELTPRTCSLEETFLRITAGSVEYAAGEPR
ncbi:ATP-binding cassette domain-containing protein [Streptomyces sp. P6-2-1]|uniref:ATP-binding cassette domain-containing protein n=1 Tax=unclassified Streptomyces TaxID=2593676 RepID=UPI003D36E512